MTWGEMSRRGLIYLCLLHFDHYKWIEKRSESRLEERLMHGQVQDLVELWALL